MSEGDAATLFGERESQAFTVVGRQILALASCLHLEASTPLIMRIFGYMCRESLAFPWTARPPGTSRINHDNMPIQFAVDVGLPHPALQFLSDAGDVREAGLARYEASRRCIQAVAQGLQVTTMSSLDHLFEILTPASSQALLSASGGAFWIGAAFTADRGPRLKVYFNGRWGSQTERWTRLQQFAHFFGQSQRWDRVHARLASAFEPLGAAITLQGSSPPSGRIYLGTYGKTLPLFKGLAEDYGNSVFGQKLKQFCRSILPDDYAYPMPSAVCSFGLGTADLDFKFELCSHCVFSSDVQAARLLNGWFDYLRVDARVYTQTLAILSEERLSSRSTNVHCYAGLGLRKGVIYSTIYLKPSKGFH